MSSGRIIGQISVSPLGHHLTGRRCNKLKLRQAIVTESDVYLTDYFLLNNWPSDRQLLTGLWQKTFRRIYSRIHSTIVLSYRLILSVDFCLEWGRLRSPVQCFLLLICFCRKKDLRSWPKIIRKWHFQEMWYFSIEKFQNNVVRGRPTKVIVSYRIQGNKEFDKIKESQNRCIN